MSDYIKQNGVEGCRFDSSESWVILSEIEQRIKAKIEAVGTPLKDWDINIYRGILTGYNEAFIIDKVKKEEILANCQTDEERQKTAEIIRPILRGRDIKRYSYEFADLYIITTFPSLKIDIESYPAVKQHLLSFGYDRLKQTGEKGARKKTNNKWFETQDSIAYWEDFSKQKIVYPETTQGAYFALDINEVMLDKTCFMIITDHSKFLIALLSSKLYEFAYKSIFSSVELGISAYQYNKHALVKLPILRGRDIKHYGYEFADLYLINTHNGVKEKGIKRINIEDYPAVKAHLDLFYPQLEKRADQGDTPYNLRNCAYIEDFYKQKIVWKAVGKNLAFSILEDGKFLTAPASFITSEKGLYYILGFLCSSFGKYFIYSNSDTTGAGDIMLNIQSLIKIPIPQLESNKQKTIEDKVFEIINLKGKNISTDTLEKDIDSLINNIFGFNDDEISFIENT